MTSKDLGLVTAYAYAVSQGYTGTEEEFAELMASYATVAEEAAESAAEAAASATAAGTSETNAASSAASAGQSATSAGNSATSASGSAVQAQSSATAAGQSATQAAGSATAAGNSATAAAGSATAAAASETAAGASATAAAGSATSAGNSATAAAGSADAADASADRAQEILDSIPEDYSELSEDVANLSSALNKFYSQSTDNGDIFRFDSADYVLKVVPDAAVTLANQNIMPNTITRTSANPVITDGITYYANSDKSITIRGTATANVTIWINQILKIPKGKYTLSGCPAGGGNSTYRLACLYRKDGSDNTWLIDTGNGATGTLNEDIDNIRCYVSVFSGATVDITVYPQLEYSPTKSEYIKCANQSVSADTAISIDGIKTIFADSAFNVTISKFGWYAMQTEVDELSASVSDMEDATANLLGLASEHVNHFNPNDYSLICIHHDNFMRTESGWDIGMNAGGTDVGNNYEWVTSPSYDDGLRVSNGATFEKNNARANTYSLRKIATDHKEDFAIETSLPPNQQTVVFGALVTDINNFTIVSIYKSAAYVELALGNITNGSATRVFSETMRNISAETITLYVLKGWLYVYLDDQLALTKYIGSLGTELYLASHKSNTTHFDFVNVFNLENKVEFNPNHILDTGVSSVSLITTSANAGGYTLQNEIARWSDYADKFLLHSDDALVYSGRRTERSVQAPIAYRGNLRHIKCSFDVFFPSDSVDTEMSDIMYQMHDRDGTYRGYVPVIFSFKNGKISLGLASTEIPKGGASDVIKWVQSAELNTVELDKWHRFEIEIKERYMEKQHPFMQVKIDDEIVFESHKPNCFNDLLGSSPQYGIYKNEWGSGVTVFERYFDNFKITY